MVICLVLSNNVRLEFGMMSRNFSETGKQAKTKKPFYNGIPVVDSGFSLWPLDSVGLGWRAMEAWPWCPLGLKNSEKAERQGPSRGTVELKIELELC